MTSALLPRLVPARLTEADNRRMFDRLAPRYDLMNRVMSLNLDQAWRKAAVRALAPRDGGTYVDVGVGTGDLAAHLLQLAPGARVVGVDPARGMMHVAHGKVPAARLAQASGIHLPLPNGSVDGVMSAFVLRNLPDVDAYFREARRVLKPGGALSNLEIGRVEGALLAPLWRVYFYGVMPRVGRLVSGDRGAYDYLADSVKVVPLPREFAGRMEDAGFEDVTVRTFSRGAVGLVTGRA